MRSTRAGALPAQLPAPGPCGTGAEALPRLVMAGVGKLVAKRLKLKVNAARSAVARPSQRRFPVGFADIPPGDRPKADGFSFTGESRPRRRIAPLALARFKTRLRDLTRCTKGASLAQMVEGLSRYLIGWRGYFGFCETPSVLRSLDQWIRRRLRAIAWQQWKRGRTRFTALRRRGIGKDLAAQTAGSPHGPWRLANSPALAIALSNASLGALGLAFLAPDNAA